MNGPTDQRASWPRACDANGPAATKLPLLGWQQGSSVPPERMKALALSDSVSAPLRCPACQLQLCKGRNESPHAALTKVELSAPGDFSKRFTCQKCGARMINSRDMTKPGWQHQRP